MSKPTNLIERLTGDLECVLDAAPEAAELIRKIQRALSGREWDSETPCVIAGLLEDAGIEVREFGDLLDFVVTYYEKEDKGMDTPLTFCCSAEDEDHAVEQCQDAYPGCTTTYVEEIER